MHVVLSQTETPSRQFLHVAIYVIKQVVMTPQLTNVSTNNAGMNFHTLYRLTVIYDRGTNKYYDRSSIIMGFQEGISKTEIVNSVFLPYSYCLNWIEWMKWNWISLHCHSSEFCIHQETKYCSSPAYCSALKHTLNLNKLNQWKYFTQFSNHAKLLQIYLQTLSVSSRKYI